VHNEVTVQCVLSNKRHRIIREMVIRMVLCYFIDIKSFRSHYGPGVDSASNRNEYLGVKAACA